MALISVLTLTSILLMMVISLYLSARGGLFSSMNHQRRTQSLYTAEAGLADTMEALEAANFNLPGPLSGTLPSGGTWDVQFAAGPPYTDLDSVNNLTNPNGWAESYRGPATVPPSSALIIVRARAGGIERVLEAVITRGGGPINLTNAIQTSGALVMEGNVKIDGVKALNDATPVPGSVHSNASSGTAVKWDPMAGSALITGMVSSVASGASAIDLAGYTPQGGTQDGKAPAPFPNINIAGTVSSKSAAPSPALNPMGTSALGGGDFYNSGDVVLNGDLKLDGTNLYIDGNLTVNGSITGTGSVYVSGETALKGDSQIAGNDNIALYSRGNVSLTGFDGNLFLNSLASSDPTFATNWAQAQGTIMDMQATMASAAANTDMVGAGALKNDLDSQRRTLGYPSGSGLWKGYNNDLMGRLATTIQAQPPSSARDFLSKKFLGLKDVYVNWGPENGVNPATITAAQVVTEWQSGAWQTGSNAYIGIFDAAIDGGYDLIMPELVNLTNQIDYDKLGTSYFQGMIYTNGYVYAAHEVNVLGAVLTQGDSSLPSATINGKTVKPGDIYLANGTRVTYVESLFTNPIGSAAGPTVAVETWIGR
ncbi:MAG: hypothetical protein AMXMBFR33_20820 [Candidatus Xenobia bacterium]|jgi:cytoskeletal protein CcmA (bactofilin family)